jgi:tRNA(Ile)-lysidine synthetase-like protein
MSTTIITFWKENRAYWITPPSKHKEVDALISNMFWGFNHTTQNLIGQIIYLDQFSRHFQRAGHMTEYEVERNREMAIKMIHSRFDELKPMDEVEIIFALMPFKHMGRYEFIFEYLHRIWLQSRKLIDLPLLQKFYMDTYKKAFTLETVKDCLVTDHPDEPYDPSLICDYYPHKYCYEDWKPIVSAETDALVKLLKFDKKVIVSLSGGVDSMVMLALLASQGTDVEAVHIVYGNRSESEHEYRFLARYCKRLGVKLTVYRIKWLRRGEIDRQFYEDMTRDLRFMVYKAYSSDAESAILLGHIQDDVVENIWTNIAYCHHLDNLKKMKAEEIQYGVRIMRPFLTAEKKDIYTMSERLGIPYLKNTTPSWSNRGKFREHFHKATVEQFGEGIDGKLIQFAEAIQTQHTILTKLLYDPIYNSFKDNQIDITPAVKVGLDANSWVGIFEHICHKHFDISRPSIKCVQNFCERLARVPWSVLNVDMGKHFKVRVSAVEGSRVCMEFLILT